MWVTFISAVPLTQQVDNGPQGAPTEPPSVVMDQDSGTPSKSWERSRLLSEDFEELVVSNNFEETVARFDENFTCDVVLMLDKLTHSTRTQWGAWSHG